jgi:hypothetical protein
VGTAAAVVRITRRRAIDDSAAVAPASQPSPSPADRYARAAGVALVAAGLVGVVFGAGLVGGGWQAALHLATGLLGLAAAGRWARDCALGLGLLYAILGVWGLAAGPGAELLGAFGVTTAAAILHLGLGLTGLGAGAATATATMTPARARRPRARV